MPVDPVEDDRFDISDCVALGIRADTAGVMWHRGAMLTREPICKFSWATKCSSSPVLRHTTKCVKALAIFDDYRGSTVYL